MTAVVGCVPTFTPVLAAGKAVSPSMSQAEARRQLSVHQGALLKLLASRYLSLQKACVEAAARADFVTIASGRVLVLQTDVANESTEVPSWRTHVGDGPDLTDAEWLDASRGDWHGFDSDQALRAGYALITLGSFITGVIKLHQLELSRHERYQIKHRFQAEIVARLIPPYPGQPPLADVERSRHTVSCSAGEQTLARLLGRRIRPKAGPQAYLWSAASPSSTTTALEVHS